MKYIKLKFVYLWFRSHGLQATLTNFQTNWVANKRQAVTIYGTKVHWVNLVWNNLKWSTISFTVLNFSLSGDMQIGLSSFHGRCSWEGINYFSLSMTLMDLEQDRKSGRLAVVKDFFGTWLLIQFEIACLFRLIDGTLQGWYFIEMKFGRTGGKSSVKWMANFVVSKQWL